jgi:Zn-dependent protease
MLITSNVTTLAIIFASLIISITLHEAMHAFTGHWLGDDTAEQQGRISLNPLRHIDPFGTILLPLITLVVFHVPLLAAKPVPFNPSRVRYGEYGAALVGIAGPLTNLGLAILGALFIHTSGGLVPLGLFHAIEIFVEINVALFVFNMIPIPPLDGSRLLYAFAPESMQGIMAQLEQLGIFIIFTLIIVFPGFSTILFNLNTAVLNVLL